MIEYVIWDFDGTLFDTYPLIASTILEIMKTTYNIELNKTKVKDWCQISLDFCFNELSSNYKINKEELKNLFSQKYAIQEDSKQPPFSGTEEILKYIKNNGGKNFIISHRGTKSLNRLLRYYKMESLFDEIITGDHNFPNKPDPTSFLFLINKHDIPLDQIISIGDRDIDIQAAKSINIKSCYFNPDGKINQLADINIKNLIELKEILQF